MSDVPLWAVATIIGLLTLSVAQYRVWRETYLQLQAEKEKFKKEYDASFDIRAARIYGEMVSLLQTYDSIIAREPRNHHEAEAVQDFIHLREKVLEWGQPLEAYMRDYGLGRKGHDGPFPAPFPVPTEAKQ